VADTIVADIKIEDLEKSLEALEMNVTDYEKQVVDYEKPSMETSATVLDLLASESEIKQPTSDLVKELKVPAISKVPVPKSASALSKSPIPTPKVSSPKSAPLADQILKSSRRSQIYKESVDPRLAAITRSRRTQQRENARLFKRMEELVLENESILREIERYGQKSK
jgi:hypothetical protein